MPATNEAPTVPNALPMERLILSRMEELGLSMEDMLARLHMAQRPRTLNLLHRLMQGTVPKKPHLLTWLPAAIEVDPEVVQNALAATHETLRRRKAEEEARHASLIAENWHPAAMLVTERRIPQPLFVGFLGMDNLTLLGDLPENITRAERVALAMERAQARVARWGGERIPGFGRALGVRVEHLVGDVAFYDFKGREAPALEDDWMNGFPHRAGERPLPG
jgi:transcriptional regulator with XRE-family HTH domain